MLLKIQMNKMEKEKEEITRKGVSLYWGLYGGETSLYLGRYTMSEDIEKRKKKLKLCSFR